LKVKAHILFFVLLIFSGNPFLSQNTDSLKLILSNASQDTTKLKLLIELSDACEIDEVDGYVNSAIKLCKKNLKNITNERERYVYFKYLALAFNNKGFINDQFGNVDKALKYYNLSLKIQEVIQDKKGMSYSLNNIAYVYDNQSDVPKALEYLHKALKIQESIDDKRGIAISLINIGNISKAHGDESKALEYFERGLKLNEELNDKANVAVALLNIGDIYYKKGQVSVALNYFNKSLKLYEEIGDQFGASYAMINLGHIYQKQGDTDKALSIFYKSIAIQEAQLDKAGIAKTLVNVTMLLYKQGKVDLALESALRAMKIAKELGYPEELKATSELLSKIYAKKGSYQNAYEMQLLFKQMADSLNRQTNRKAAIQKGLQYEYEKKVAADSIKVAAERNIFDVKIKQGKTQRTALYLGIAVIALFSLFMYNRFRVTRKQKQIIEVQKTEVEQQRQLADERRIVAEDQKHIIEEKQKEILDSIHYAKRIQQAMLTSEEYITANFSQKNDETGRDYFIFYQPKDIVSGDFYWALSHHGKFYIAAADCTGHGVPGAFMSLLNISFLNANVIESGFKEPAAILNEQRKEIIKALNPSGTENSKDGMDCALCAFDIHENKMQFALSNNPLWLVRNQELIEIKGDKMPVGKYDENTNDFTAHVIDLQKGDIIYLLTDGYADQFGGVKGKKFKYRHLKELILANAAKSMTEQKEILSKTINDWKSGIEQVDDILIIGVRV
jgi:serine phosphatase RsbU (regulator of sigma subunit)